MLRLKNLFLPALIAIIAGLLVIGCTWEDDNTEEELPVAYTVTLSGGVTMEFYDTDVNAWEDAPSGSQFYAGDKIALYYAPGSNGRVFSVFTGISGLTLDANNTFTMPARDLTIGAIYNIPGESFIRFTWEKELETYADYNINYIIASVDDYEWWAVNILADLDIDEEDFYPGFPGSAHGRGNPGVTATIFDKYGLINSKGVAGVSPEPNPNKGYYWPTNAGKFTAVCGAEDRNPGTGGDLEIVADYTITVDPATAAFDGEDIYFEVSFDVTKLLDIDYATGEDYIWFGEYDNDTETPHLQSPALRSQLSQYLNPLKKKSSVKKLKTVKQATRSGGATMEVTYYLIRRAK